jgi:AbiV family abortive infection protein
MRPRRAYKLASRSRPALLEALAEGMALLVEHVSALERAAERLRGQETPRAVEAIGVISDEEAAKFLILLDAARCAYQDARVKRDQLKRTSSHIAKGIYARAADIRPADYAELLRFVEGLRRSHYLDGPNDVDWIFRNEIEAEREERLYVDYVETDEGDMWISPERYDDLGARYPSAAVELVGAFSRAGLCDPRALGVVAEVWRNFQPEHETRWSDNEQLTRATVEQLPADAVDDELSDEDIRRILETWTFPLWGADMRIVEEDLERLWERQREWDPDGRSLTDYY